MYRLKNELYGSKKAPRDWLSHINSYLIKNIFYKSESEPTLYTKVNGKGNMLIIFLYVDDLLFTHDFGITEFRTVIESEFEMIYLGLVKFFLGIELQDYKSGIFIS